MSEKIPAIKVKQWLPEWDEVDFSERELRRKPQSFFYMFSISAKKLRGLAAVYRRDTTTRAEGVEDLGIQRQHDPKRSDEIKKFVQWGYPWSNMSTAQQERPESKSLRKPGWLPTAIVVNILSKDDVRNGKKVDESDLVRIDSVNNEVIIPDGIDDDWHPQSVSPIEVIDGQHRLWAFDGLSKDIELPVVAFYGLDISWQAYLFWSINIMPKKINPSLAFDLYPLLRAEDWLENFLGPVVYREARAQEIVEILWTHVDSPWHHRINMLGDRGVKAQVSQAAWIRAMLSSYIKAWKAPEKMLGGFFGVLGDGVSVIPWTRTQQAMFIILIGNKLREAVRNHSDYEWIKVLSEGTLQQIDEDVAFKSKHCLLNTDQGIRGFLEVTNNIFCALYGELRDEYLAVGDIEVPDSNASYGEYSANFESCAPQLTQVIDAVVDSLSAYDWRSFEAEGLDETAKNIKAGFRGSGGYKLIRNELLKCLGNVRNSLVGQALSRIK